MKLIDRLKRFLGMKVQPVPVLPPLLKLELPDSLKLQLVAPRHEIDRPRLEINFPRYEINIPSIELNLQRVEQQPDELQDFYRKNQSITNQALSYKPLVDLELMLQESEQMREGSELRRQEQERKTANDKHLHEAYQALLRQRKINLLNTILEISFACLRLTGKPLASVPVNTILSFLLTGKADNLNPAQSHAAFHGFRVFNGMTVFGASSELRRESDDNRVFQNTIDDSDTTSLRRISF